MKFIHTADWHLGNRMHDVDRKSEFENFFSWLKEEIMAEKAETLVISGDIYDTVNPPVDSRKQYIQFLASLCGTDCRNVVVVGGNHDSGNLLDSEKDILEILNIHVVGSLCGTSTEKMVFELFDMDGNVNGICAAVPFARESELREFFDGECEDGSFSDKAFSALYGKVFEEAKKLRGERQIPIIATGHLYAADLEGRFEGLNREVKTDDGIRVLDVVGNLGSVHAGVFPKELDYVALGHIHYSTMVAKNPRIRYSGSPFVLGFDEANLPRHVLSVEVSSGEEPLVSKIEVPRFCEYRRISGDSKTIRTELSKYISKVSEKDTFIEIFYKKEIGVNIHEELEDIISALPENVSVVSRKVQDSGMIFSSGLGNFQMEELKTLSPEEIFKNLILSKSASFTENQNSVVEKFLPMFKLVAQEVENGEDL